jgi:hypothetical protein
LLKFRLIYFVTEWEITLVKVVWKHLKRKLKNDGLLQHPACFRGEAVDVLGEGLHTWPQFSLLALDMRWTQIGNYDPAFIFGHF